MKRLSLQWRITIMTALLTCAACVLTNCLVGYTGMRYMDAIGSNISAFNATGEDSPQAFDPTKATPDDKVTIVVNDAQESFGTTTWYITAGITLLGGVLTYFVSGRALKPLRDFAAQVERVQPDNLSEIRLSEDVPTELQQCSASFNDMIARLGEGFSAQRQFTGNAAHELRTPLTSIRGWVETLRTLDDPADENYRKGLEIINNETARLYNMVEELLDFSRLQNGRLKMTCRPLDLVAELTDAVLFCEARIQREGLVLVYNEPEEMIPVYADPDRLRQVFINILDNAIKYSAPGGRITVKLWAGEYKAFIELIDQGRGIPPEDLENVKTKFYKGSNSVRGSGIGLALVDSIMTALDGTLDIKSTLGRGTVVTLGLPLYHKA